jgi:hypothetical protein
MDSEKTYWAIFAVVMAFMAGFKLAQITKPQEGE